MSKHRNRNRKRQAKKHDYASQVPSGYGASHGWNALDRRTQVNAVEEEQKEDSRFMKGLKAFGGFLWRMFFRVRLVVATPFLWLAMLLVVPKELGDFIPETWEMFVDGRAH